ncbi:hypothetical protein CDAR_264981 [Caerostris darwini]|uniref:Uncharacterized protein n=1 Tax=Caerostris darwini TaxID=1538125 RepID=A0AAV4W4K9_9ARAC|nr:hypothetical protein CDAR_264981 [Caerostris darwini]
MRIGQELEYEEVLLEYFTFPIDLLRDLTRRTIISAVVYRKFLRERENEITPLLCRPQRWVFVPLTLFEEEMMIMAAPSLKIWSIAQCLDGLTLALCGAVVLG